MADYDSLYHRIFAHPEMVRQIIRGFVREPWVADLDLDRMERENTKFHARRGKRRESDVVWRIPRNSGGDAYLLLILEFQSRADRWMALRIMVYAGLLWQQIAARKGLAADGRLPPVFPVVIYNGDSPWAAPVSLDALIGLPQESPLWQWQPGARYHILDQGRYSKADLAGRDTLAALMFQHCRRGDEVVRLVDAVIDWFRRHDGFEALEPLFATLAWRVIETAEGVPPGVQVSENLLEVRTMLATRVTEWQQQWRQEGRLEGEAKVLLRLLERRFGPVPDAVRERIGAAGLADLDTWIMRVLDAAAIDDIFV